MQQEGKEKEQQSLICSTTDSQKIEIRISSMNPRSLPFPDKRLTFCGEIN